MRRTLPGPPSCTRLYRTPREVAAGVLAGCLASGLMAVVQAQPRACQDLQPAAVLQQVNALRAEGGVCGSRGGQAPTAALQWSVGLHELALQQAHWLAEQGQLSHSGRGGLSLRQRAEAAGYAYQRIAENVAYGQQDVPQVLRGWVASEGHCVNVYDSRVSEMALACVPGRDGRPYWALLLARPLRAP